MKYAPIPDDEKKRLCALENLGLLDTETEERFDRLTKEAVRRFNVPIATITLIDKDREWFKSSQGLDVKQGPRNTSFCGHALLAQVIMIVEDTLNDPRFKDNPAVAGSPFIRFYAGKSLYDRKTNLAVGVFCIKDYSPRKMSLKDTSDFLELAGKAEDVMNGS